MNAMAYTHPIAHGRVKPRVTRRRVLARAYVAGSVAGLVGGTSAGLIGSVFTVAGWFVTDEGARQWLSTAGSALLFLTIPLLILGGFCLDGLEKNRPQRRLRLVRNDNDE